MYHYNCALDYSSFDQYSCVYTFTPLSHVTSMCFLTTSLNWCDTSLLLVYYLVLHHTLVDCLIASNSFFLPLEAVHCWLWEWTLLKEILLFWYKDSIYTSVMMASVAGDMLTQLVSSWLECSVIIHRSCLLYCVEVTGDNWQGTLVSELGVVKL